MCAPDVPPSFGALSCRHRRGGHRDPDAAPSVGLGHAHPIGEHALLSDSHSAALTDRHGPIEWRGLAMRPVYGGESPIVAHDQGCDPPARSQFRSPRLGVPVSWT